MCLDIINEYKSDTEVTSVKRIGSIIIDLIVFVFIFLILLLVFIISSSNNEIVNSYYLQISIFLSFALFLNKDIINGRSIGKRIFNHEILSLKSNYKKLPLICLLRNLTILILPIEFVKIILTPGTRYGDKIAGTKVIIHNPQIMYAKRNFDSYIFSLVLGCLVSGIIMFPLIQKINNYRTDSIKFDKSSFNNRLSNEINNYMDSCLSDYLIKSKLQIYDRINGDSAKYIAADVQLKRNYIKDKNDLKYISDTIFKSVNNKIKEGSFILHINLTYSDSNFIITNKNRFDSRKFKN